VFLPCSSLVFGVWVWSVVCGMWYVMYGVWCVVRGPCGVYMVVRVLYVVCDAFSSVCVWCDVCVVCWYGVWWCARLVVCRVCSVCGAAWCVVSGVWYVVRLVVCGIWYMAYGGWFVGDGVV